MAYCRRCGTQLKEEALFCHKCGTQVAVITQTPPPPTPSPINSQTYQAPPPPAASQPTTATSSSRKDPWVLIAVGLVVVLVLAVTIVAFLMVPLGYWSFANNSYGSNVSKLDFNLEININQLVPTIQNLGLFKTVETPQLGMGSCLETVMPHQ
ncbi:MAG: zinc ribbon domain-containing protein [Candidatus Bathyarchaeota archaeon]|nr:zinc ribbon domain-containing protein [Candidatus Termitimicrobium sp.]